MLLQVKSIKINGKIESLSKRIKDEKNDKIQISQWKNTITKIQKLTRWAQQKTGDDRGISEFEYRATEIIQSKQQQEKKNWRRKKQSLRPWGTTRKGLTLESQEGQDR